MIAPDRAKRYQTVPHCLTIRRSCDYDT
jgi:hypothetical protein